MRGDMTHASAGRDGGHNAKGVKRADSDGGQDPTKDDERAAHCVGSPSPISLGLVRHGQVGVLSGGPETRRRTHALPPIEVTLKTENNGRTLAHRSGRQRFRGQPCMINIGKRESASS